MDQIYIKIVDLGLWGGGGQGVSAWAQGQYGLSVPSPWIRVNHQVTVSGQLQFPH